MKKFSWSMPLFLLFFISCTKSGALTGGSAGTSSFSGSINGSVNGGLTGVAGATINLMIAGNSVPVTTATTASDGSFSLTFSNPGRTSLLYVSVTGGNAGGGTNTKAQFLSIAGTTASPFTTLRVNEMTTAATELVGYNLSLLTDTNGVITLAAPKTAGGASNAANDFTNFISTGNLNTANSNLTTSAQNGLKVMANAFASCIQTPANCSNLFNNATSTSGTAAASLLESGLNALNNSSNVASSLYTIAFPLNTSTGFTLTSATIPGGFTFNNALPITQNTFNVGGSPAGIAIDASGNVWTNGTSNVVEMNSSGTVINTVSVGSVAGSAIAIDQSGNVWAAGTGSSAHFVTELNSSGTILGTFASGLSGGGNPCEGVAIDGSGNAWLVCANTFYEFQPSGFQSLAVTHSLNNNREGIGIDPSGNVWISGGKKYAPNGTLLLTINNINGTELGMPFDVSGNFWGLFAFSETVTQASPSGVILGTYNLLNLSNSAPGGIAIDPSGNVWAAICCNGNVDQLPGAAGGPQSFPYSGPVFP